MTMTMGSYTWSFKWLKGINKGGMDKVLILQPDSRRHSKEYTKLEG